MSRSMTAALVAACLLGWSTAHATTVTSKTFSLQVEAKFLSCISASATTPPTATVHVQRAGERDTLTLTVDGLKPNLQFDVFTVQRSNLLANGTVNPAFTNFGLAWYQSDLNANKYGHASTTLFTILIDQIFGFDPDVSLAPTNTFHLGFWFNRPKDAAPCGFIADPTPFNGQHVAGPAAMISVPDATTGLGPLCLNPESSNPSGCNN